MAASHDRDRLEVMVLEARGLLPVAEGVANPYVSVEVGDEKRRTAVEPSTVDPVWDEEIMVFSETSTTASNLEHLVLMVKHHEPVGNQTDRTLGMVIVDTATALQAPGISTQEWLLVRKGPGMRAGDVPQGRVHVKVTYFVNSLEELDAIDEDDNDDGVDAKAPNVVSLLVEAGRNLRPPGSKSVCSPMLVVRCSSKVKQCKAQKQTNNPRWHFQVQMWNVDPQEPVVIEVVNSGTMSNKLIGQARLTMVEIAQAGQSLTRWLQLLDERWGFDAMGRGEVVVTARWHYDKDFTRKPTILSSTFTGGKAKKLERERQALEAMVGEFEYEDDNDERHQHQSEEVIPGAEEELDEAQEEEKERERQALADRVEYQARLDDVRPGDYQIQVHIIEAADLKGLDASGTSDPIVYVDCLGLKKHTRVRKGVTSAVFDEVLYFTLPKLSRDQLMQAIINVRVLDANTFLRDSLIGSYQFDFLGIYVEQGHEVYRKWVALQDTESGGDTGVQGFLKLSVTVLGPGDRQRVHDLAEEMQHEIATEAEAGPGARGGMVLMGPTLTPQELRHLVVYVFSAQDLPGFSAVGVPSINAVAQVDFAGNPPIRTTAMKAKGRDGLSVVWAQQLWLPVMVPTHSTTINLSIWHKEITGREVVAHAYFDYNDAKMISAGEKKPGIFRSKRTKKYPGPPPKWVNLYGAPAGKGKGREAEMMNRYPSRGSAFRGKVLVAMRVETGRPPEPVKRGKRSKMDFEEPTEILPEAAKYTLRALVLQGSDIPVFKFPNAQGASKMRVAVTLGRTTLEFKAASNRKGIVEWNQAEEVHMLELPADPAQIPDIIVYLIRDIPESRLCFARIPAVDVLARRFRGDPYWQELVADKTRQGLWAVGSDNFPGSLLIRLGLGRDAVARHNPWKEVELLSQESAAAGSSTKQLQAMGAPPVADREGDRGGKDGDDGGQLVAGAAAVAAQGLLGGKKPYCLRAHLFQCRRLPSSEASGLLDPYIKVRFMGHKQKTTHQGSTADPCFYETVEFHEMLPGDLRFAAEIRVEVWDKDLLGSNTHVAGCRFPISAATTSLGSTVRVPTPQWHQLSDTNGQPGVGEILLSLQLFPKRTVNDKFPKAPNITPTFRNAFLEVITVGVRNLKPYGFQTVAQPYVEFEMTSGRERAAFKTHASKFPSGKNANFVERKVAAVLLPNNPLFAPQLCIRVLDKRMSSLNNPVVGTCSVSMAEKMPWNDEGYRPPQSQSFNATDYSKDGDDGLGGESSTTPRTAPPSPDRKRSRRSGATSAGDRESEIFNAPGGEDRRDGRRSTAGGKHDGGDAINSRQQLQSSRDAHPSGGRGGSSVEHGDARGHRETSNWENGGEKAVGSSAGGRAGTAEGTAKAPGGSGSSGLAPVRPVNFGVGAIDVGGGGGGGGAAGGGSGDAVGLELPPIAEDLLYEEALRRMGEEFPHRFGAGVGVDSVGSGLNGQRSTTAGRVAADGRTRSRKKPAWYEQLFQGGGKALGVIDTEEEDRWTLDELGIDFPNEWASSEFLEGRNWWLKREGGGSEIENFLKRAPFENYPLFLGAEKLKGGVRMFRQMPKRKVGLLKGLVVVSENAPDPNYSEFVDMRLLRAPRTYICRLYVVKGLHLQAKDTNGYADPYLRFKIGKLRVNDSKDKDHIKKGTLNPDFFRAFEFPVTMPGESQLKLKLYDHDRFGFDELLGETIIDLEDRWFSKGWQELESHDPLAMECHETRGPYKPLELRDLSVPTSGNPQGQVMMWLDILTIRDARRFPPVPMEPPAPLKVEVRVVCWKSEDVTAAKDITGLRDLYCRVWMESDSKKKRDTDTHWRCKNGKGSWNFRLKFDVELPLKSPEQGRLVLQMWDRDVLSANDIIAETHIDLYRWFLKVYREERSTKPYLIMKEARKKKAKEEEDARASGRWRAEPQGGPSVSSGPSPRPKKEVDGLGNRDKREATWRKGGGRHGAGNRNNVKNTGSSNHDDDDGDDDDDEHDDNDDNDSESREEEEEEGGEEEEEEWETESESEEDTEEKPLLASQGGGEHATGNVQQTCGGQPDDTDEVVNTIKDWLGIGRCPDDGQWLELNKRDAEAGTVERMGKLLISLELLPKDAADAQAVGSGRNEPNQNPYLPPPAGRMKFSVNPFRIAMDLLGVKAFYKILCCCLCITVMVAIAVAGNYITTFESIF